MSIDDCGTDYTASPPSLGSFWVQPAFAGGSLPLSDIWLWEEQRE